MSDLVVGSGPAGVAAAAALVARGREVTMLDAGERLEPEREALRRSLAERDPAEWSEAERSAYRGAPSPQEGIRRWGSDFFFREPDEERRERPAWLALRPSYARGGLSNAWGAALLPYRARDLADWPFGLDELVPHYRAVAERLPIAASADALASQFPALEVGDRQPLPPSRQASRLAARFAAAGERLARLGVTVGASRLAVADGCRLCGLCLDGCPWNLVFGAGSLLAELERHPRFHYRSGHRVERFEERPDGVTVRFADGSLRGRRLFVASGVLPTTRLVLSSLGAGDRAVTLLDSQQLLLPTLHRWRAGTDVRVEPRHALPQLFVEIDDPRWLPTTVHAQLYTYQEVYERDMRRTYRALAPVAGPLFAGLSRRLIVAQAFLHSDHSARVEIRLERRGEREALAFTLRRRPETVAALAAVRRRLGRVARVGGLLPLTPLAREGAVGSSFHCGGTFPMRREPRELETDRLGRPHGLTRVHLVDASTFPSIPATTIALSAMANAHRIAAEAAGLPDD